MRLFNKIKEINAGKINGSSINGMTVSGDFIAVNTEQGHYEIGNKTGKTFTINLDKYVLVFVGGILVEIKEKEV